MMDLLSWLLVRNLQGWFGFGRWCRKQVDANDAND